MTRSAVYCIEMNLSARSIRKHVLVCAVLAQACAQDEVIDSPTTLPLTAAGYRPSIDTSWQIQFTGQLDTSVNAELFDVDLFDTSVETIKALQARGTKVICYFDTAYESWRPDASELERFRRNPMDGWPGQYWLDIRMPKVIDVLEKRVELAKQKGCDGVEADDVDLMNNDPGFKAIRGDQQQLVVTLAKKAHDLDLAFGLKNALDDIDYLLSHVDFEINEECFKYRECEKLDPFIAAGKPVFQLEYTDGSFEELAAEVCPKSRARRFRTLIKHLNLDAARYACP